MSTEQHDARQRARDLAGLRLRWDGGYQITWDAGQFLAVRRDTGASVRKGTAAGLAEEIRADYAAMPASSVNSSRDCRAPCQP